MKTYKIVNLKDYAMFVDINGVTKTIPAGGYLIVSLNDKDTSSLKAKYRDSLKFLDA